MSHLFFSDINCFFSLRWAVIHHGGGTRCSSLSSEAAPAVSRRALRPRFRVNDASVVNPRTLVLEKAVSDSVAECLRSRLSAKFVHRILAEVPRVT